MPAPDRSPAELTATFARALNASARRAGPRAGGAMRCWFEDGCRPPGNRRRSRPDRRSHTRHGPPVPDRRRRGRAPAPARSALRRRSPRIHQNRQSRGASASAAAPSPRSRVRPRAARRLSCSASSRSQPDLGCSGPRNPASAVSARRNQERFKGALDRDDLAARRQLLGWRTRGWFPASRIGVRRRGRPARPFVNQTLVDEGRPAPETRRPSRRHPRRPSRRPPRASSRRRRRSAGGRGSCSGGGEQVVAPGDRVAQRLLSRGQIARATGKRRKPAVETVEQCLR